MAKCTSHIHKTNDKKHFKKQKTNENKTENMYNMTKTIETNSKTITK